MQSHSSHTEVRKKTDIQPNYVTSSDPHHDMSIIWFHATGKSMLPWSWVLWCSILLVGVWDCYFGVREFASWCHKGLQMASKSATLWPPATQNARETHTLRGNYIYMRDDTPQWQPTHVLFFVRPEPHTMVGRSKMLILLSRRVFTWVCSFHTPLLRSVKYTFLFPLLSVQL